MGIVNMEGMQRNMGPGEDEDAASLKENIAAAEGGMLPGLCRKHYAATCRKGRSCPKMHGVMDKRYEFKDIPGVVMPTAGSVYPWTDGTASVVLDIAVDPKYSPSSVEIKEYAAWVGMDLETDGPLTWVAIEGLQAPVPSPWRSCKTDQDEVYFFNFANGCSSWDHPLDSHIKHLFIAEKAALATRRKEAKFFLLAWKRLHGQHTFPMLLEYLVSFICPEPRSIE
eukprot:TRINITY_DN4885_c0_g1_i2.p1 TRINITY_DN4885_c0_g1~~TRINITY_DN4885_c0_g1_i2.p1  ORF type:complete len:232 (+),score=45.35 TRINITY_DN4885_c0_g1_i2:23-697(+)